MNLKQRIAVGLLTMSAAGFATWKASEEFVSAPMIPTKGDVPTIGYGSTRYEDGRAVKLTDPPISRKRAEELAKNLNSASEKQFAKSLEGAKLNQAEFDLYMDFVGQFGIGNWRKSSMRRYILQERYADSCRALLAWRQQDGRDCSLEINWGRKGCKGVWTRQLKRHADCMAAQ